MAAAVLGSAFQENFSNGGFQSMDELDLQSLNNGKPYQNFSEFRLPSDGMKHPSQNHSQSPSPPKKSSPKHRSVTDPQTFIDQAKLEAKLSRPRATQRRKERAKVLSGLPASHLVEKLVYEEFDAQESRRLLKDAMSRLDIAEKRATQAETDRRTLEMAQAVQGLKVMQTTIDSQGELAKAKQDSAVFKHQLHNAEIEIERHRERIRQLERQRDDAESAANSARSLARESDNQRILAMMQADTQKRWLEENLRSLTAAARRKHRYSPSDSPIHHDRRDTIHDAAGSQLNDYRTILEDYKRELMDSFRREAEEREATRQLEIRRMDDERKLERERAERKEREMEHERELMKKRDKDRNNALQQEFDNIREKERKFRRQKAELQDKEADMRRQRDKAKDKIRDLEKELQDLKKQLEVEKERAEKAEKEAEKAKERAEKAEKEVSQRPPGTLPRVLMPPPPNPNLVPRLPSPPPLPRPPPASEMTPPPRAPAAPVVPPPGVVSQPQPMPGMFPPQQIQPNPYPGRPGRASTGTPESVSTITVNSAHDILTFDDGNRKPGASLQRQLSAITETSEVPTASPSRASASPSPGPGPSAGAGPPPSWFMNPPADFSNKKQSIDQWRRSTSDAMSSEPDSPGGSDYLHPARREGATYLSPNDPSRITKRSSAGSFDIYVEAPSAPASSVGENSGDTDQQPRPSFLSPNSAHSLLPREQEPPQRQQQAPPPVIPSTIIHGAPPPGFVMTSFTPAPGNQPGVPPPPVIPSSPSTRPNFLPSSPGQPVIPPPPVIPPSSSSSIYAPWSGQPTLNPRTETPTLSTGSSWRPPSAQAIYSSASRGGGVDPGSRQTPHMTPRNIYQPFPSGGRQSVPPGVASTSSSTGSGGAGSYTPRSIYGAGPPPGPPQPFPSGGRQSVPPGVASTNSSTGSGGVGSHTPRSIYGAGPPPAPPQGILKRTGATTPVIPPGSGGGGGGGGRTPSSIYAGLPPAQPASTTPRQEYNDFDDEDNDDFDPVTRRNTEANSMSRLNTQTPTPAIPIPPPGFPRPQM